MKPEEQNFLDAMVKLYKDEESTDAYLVCQGIRKPVHKAVLVARSPSFLGTKLKRWSGEKKEIVIEDCDPEVLDIVVDYMYGIKIPDLDCLQLIKVLEISEIFLMTDLKAHLESLAVKILGKTNVKLLCEKADMFACGKLLEACVQLMVKEGISFDKEEVLRMPDATVAFLRAFKAEMDKKKDSEMELGSYPYGQRRSRGGMGWSGI